jgi:hypothetical protein
LSYVLSLARLALLEAWRTRVSLVMLVVLACGLAISALLGQVAITETAQIQAVVLAAFLRIAAVLIVASFVIVSQARELSDKSIELILSLPMARVPYLLGKLAGNVLAAWIMALLFGVCLLPFARTDAVSVWTLSLGLELTIIACASLFFALTLSQVPAALAAVIGFYLLSRSMAAFQLMSTSQILEPGGLAQQAMANVLDVIAALLPRLDLFTQSAWLAAPSMDIHRMLPLAVQCAVYVVFLTAAAMFDLSRKNF